MAIWQWDVWLVPEKKVVEIYNDIPNEIELNFFESIAWWDEMSENKLVRFFDKILPTYDTPWAANTLSWGSDKGNRIELMVEEKQITDLVIRIDLREIDKIFLTSLVYFAKKNRLVFFAFESRSFIKPNLSELIGKIGKSRKIKFVENCEHFFEDSEYLDELHMSVKKLLD